jgi:hypothetical protein
MEYVDLPEGVREMLEQQAGLEALMVPEGMQMNFLTVYDPATGEILETHKSPGQIGLSDPTQVFVAVEANMKTQYVWEGEVVDRPVMNVTLDGSVLKGVPSGATVTIDDTDYEADGSDIELSFTLKARHHIGIKMWPYMPAEVVYEDQP